MNNEKNWETGDLERAGRLRREAELLENRERVRSRLRQLMELSQDPYYDQYLAQMWKDLESGKATPWQVEQEAQRSYLQYRQRMSQAGAYSASAQPGQKQRQIQSGAGRAEGERFHAEPLPVPDRTWEKFGQPPAGSEAGSVQRPDSRSNLEFRIGVHVFSIIGAVFVLAAFVIFGFQFLGGLWQGMCLYGAALLPVILSELLSAGRARKAGRSAGEQTGLSEGGAGEKSAAVDKDTAARGRDAAGASSRISCVVTGIGIGALYAANIVNYLVLHTINAFEAMAAVLAIAAGAIFLGRKKNSALIRIISLIGCYLCFLSVGGLESKLDFLVVTLMLFVINTAGVLFQNQKNRTAINTVHMILTLIFTCVITFKARLGTDNAVYLVLHVVTSFVFINIMSFKTCVKEKTAMFPICCIGNGLCIFLLFLIGNFEPQVSLNPELALFVHLTAQSLILAVCLVTFMLWDKGDGRRWAQLYYWVSAVVLLGTFSDYNLEILISVLLAFLAVKLCAGNREVFFLDCVMVAWVGIFWCGITDSWPCLLFAAALFLSVFRIKRGYLYHEFVITAALLAIWWVQCRVHLQEQTGLNGGWLYPVSAGIMLILFLLFNHLPGLKNKNQQPYNIVSLVAMCPYYLMVWFWNSYVFSTIMMILGAVTILIVFRKRYALEIPRKYLVLAGFLVWFSLTGHYGSPVVVSILLMIIALGCVGIGFGLQDKVERICGLVMAFLVCVKLVLYDFREVEAMYRVVVFLVVGVIALLISCIYIRLEKKQTV